MVRGGRLIRPKHREDTRTWSLTMSAFESHLVRNTKRQGKSFCGGSWNHLGLAVDGEHLAGTVPIGIDRPVDELEEDFLELLASAPFMNLCSERLRAIAYETPQGVVFPWHHIVFFAEPEGWTVITLAVSQVDKSLLSFDKSRCSDPIDDLTLHSIRSSL